MLLTQQMAVATFGLNLTRCNISLSLMQTGSLFICYYDTVLVSNMKVVLGFALTIDSNLLGFSVCPLNTAI